MICSHKLAYKYFTASLADSSNDTCKFSGYPWDGSYENAKEILDNKMNGTARADGPEMGLNAPNSGRRGRFLVITSTEEPYCRM